MLMFLGTLLVFTLCCLGLGLGLLLAGRPLRGGCGSHAPNDPRCADCPHRGIVDNEDRNEDRNE